MTSNFIRDFLKIMNGTIICNKWEQSENSVNFEEMKDRCLAFGQLWRDLCNASLLPLV
jgi:hypothetical protein